MTEPNLENNTFINCIVLMLDIFIPLKIGERGKPLFTNKIRPAVAGRQKGSKTFPPVPGRRRAQKNAGYGFKNPYTASRSTLQNPNKHPLYKKRDRQYNKNRNVPMIRLRMELYSPYAGDRCSSTCFCIAPFLLCPTR